MNCKYQFYSRWQSGFFFAFLALASSTSAAPVVLDGSIEFSVFDQGGVLDFANTNSHVGAIEVMPDGVVYVLLNAPHLGVLTTEVQLLRSTGMNTAQLAGDPQPISIMPWAADLTRGPNNLLYVAGAMGGQGGIFGLDPLGQIPPQTYASSTCSFSTTGLTFADDNSHALVSTDGSQTSCANGLFRVFPDGTTEHLIEQLDEPVGIPRGTDDHAVMLDGRVILAGDKSHDLWDVTGGAGNVFVALDLDDLFNVQDIPGWVINQPVFGSRVTVDPVTGDLFYTHGTGAPGKEMTIIRVKSDFSSASIFAEGFSILRDLDFGPVGFNNERSLYVVELYRDGPAPSGADTGTIHQLKFPSDTDADGFSDQFDNCVLISNESQRDTNADGFGNACDADLNNDGIVNFLDVSLWREAFNTASLGDEDFNGDGFVNFLDFALFADYFLQAPGPSGLE